ncbi:MAG TPA: DMT family transporter [Symbiobacteriaceae bacterium]
MLAGFFLGLGCALAYSLTGIFIRRGSELVGPWAGVLLMFTAQTVLALATAGAMGVLQPPGLAAASLYLLVGILTSAPANSLIVSCLQIAGPARASASKVSALVLGMALGTLVLRERLLPWAWAGAALVFVGLGLLMMPARTGAPDLEPAKARTGILMGLGAGAFFAVGSLMRKVAMMWWPEPLAGAALESAGALLVFLLLPMGYRELKGLRRPGAVSYAAAGGLSLCGTVAFLSALNHIPLTVANLLAGTEPVITLVLSSLLLKSAGDKATLRQSAGVAMVTAGVMILVWAGA